MNCKFCDAPLEEDETLCPKCQKDQNEPAENDVIEEVEELEIPSATATKQPLWKVIGAVSCCVLLLGALVIAVLEGMGINATGAIVRIFKKEVKAEVVEDCDLVVAKMGDRELTNGELQVYYWTHVFDHINYYYYYGLGFDMEQPLDQQVKDEATGQTWHQYFLDLALKTWHRYEAMAILAEEAGHTLSPETQEYLDTLEESLTTLAEENGFESADAMIADRFGEGCYFRHYYAYMENYCIGTDFFDMIAADLAPTEEELEAYYQENEAELIQAGASKEDGNISNVRHILICPKADDGATEYTDEQWAAAEAAANELLEQWLAGDATEESFTHLAVENSEDPGVVENYGLYEGIYNGSGYVSAFESWAIDPARVVGETAVVKTEYGYHIMYFVSTQGPLWKNSCEQSLLSERISAEIDKTAEANPFDTYLDRLVIGDALANVVASMY